MMDRQFAFGGFRFDGRTGELRSDRKQAKLTPRAAAVLTMLAERAEKLVFKQELFERVWGGLAVSDDALTSCIQELRQALGDDARAPRYIETRHRRGYRLMEPVTVVGEGAELPGTAIAPPPGPSSLVGQVAEVGALDAAHGGHRHGWSLPLPDRPSIAVLPFVNMSGDPDQEHFADGITEDLITGLSRIHWLFVIARNSTFQYKGKCPDIRLVGRVLGIRYVLEGSVRHQGKRLRVSAQLVDAVTGGHHWAEKYDRKLGDIFAVQDEITRSVAGAIEPRLLAAEGLRALSRSAADLDAWEHVARAQAHFWRMTLADHQAAAGILERTVEAHPDYAPARSLLGFRLVFAAHMGWVDREHALAAGHRHAVRAITLDDRDPWGHIALGYWAMMERRTEESIAAFRRAVGLNPNSAAAHGYLSHIFAFAGQDREAIEHGEEAIRLSPLDPEMAFFLGGIAVAHFTVDQFVEAVRYTTEALRLRPGFQGAQRLRCASLAQAGRIDEARAYLPTVRRDQPQLSIDWIRASVPFQTQQLMERFLEGMHKAGLNGD
jgi:TolB-like protein/DNA-binding winged helix-turn-helix (wHTH) protein